MTAPERGRFFFCAAVQTRELLRVMRDLMVSYDSVQAKGLYGVGGDFRPNLVFVAHFAQRAEHAERF